MVRGRSDPWRVEAIGRPAAPAWAAAATVDVQRTRGTAIARGRDAFRAVDWARRWPGAVAGTSRSVGRWSCHRGPRPPRTVTRARSRGPRSCRRCRCRPAPAGPATPWRSPCRHATDPAGGGEPRPHRTRDRGGRGPSARAMGWTAAARVSNSSTTGASKQTATAPGTSRTSRARAAGRFQGSPGRYRCHEPFIRRCVRSSRPPSKRMMRFLPTDSTASMVRPTRRCACGTAPGPLARAAVTARPTRCGRRPAAVR